MNGYLIKFYEPLSLWHSLFYKYGIQVLHV